MDIFETNKIINIYSKYDDEKLLNFYLDKQTIQLKKN
jgi:hypothetical protein